MNGKDVITFILLIIVFHAIFSLVGTVKIDEPTTVVTLAPRYSVRERFRDCPGMGWASSNTTGSGCQFMTSQQSAQNLGWRTSMPYDQFEENMKSNMHTAASNVSPSNNGGYMKNYGSPCNA